MPESTEVDAVRRKGAKFLKLVRFEKSGGDEWLEIDQVRIPRERRKTLVGRISEAGRAERAGLPVGESGGVENIEELDNAPIKDADALAPG